MGSELEEVLQVPDNWHIFGDYSLNHRYDELIAVTKDEDDAIIEIFRDGQTRFEIGLTVLVEVPVPTEVASLDEEGNLQDTEQVRKEPLSIEVETSQELNSKLEELVRWYMENRDDAYDSVDSQTKNSPDLPEF